MSDVTWRDQYKRAARSANLVFALAEGSVTSMPPQMFDPEDAVFHFCADAFHLRDWIAAAGVDRDQFDDVKAFEKALNARIKQLDDELFKRSAELAACRDIANGYKHLVLTRPSFLPDGEHSEVVGRAFSTDFSEPQRVKATYTVQIAGLQMEAHLLAKVAMARWDTWFASSSSIAKELREEVEARPWTGWPWEPQPWGLSREMDLFPITDDDTQTDPQ